MRVVTEAIYDVRESDNCPRTFETHFNSENILDTVDEAKETYVKNHLDLDDINENKHAEEEEEKQQQNDPEAPTVDSGDTAATDGNGEAELVSPSAPDDTNSHKSNDSPV